MGLFWAVGRCQAGTSIQLEDKSHMRIVVGYKCGIGLFKCSKRHYALQLWRLARFWLTKPRLCHRSAVQAWLF
jgi:hypothetical protein